MFYFYTDHLGSLTIITNQSGSRTEERSYDAWGCLRNPDNWSYSNIPAMTLLDRGYTFHEHLPEFGLINMNGRMYDPLVARFLSPDPYVQDPESTQGFNRYSYCLNNPLKYTDPSGEFWHLIIGAVVGGVVNLMANADKVDNFWQGLGYFGTGAVAGAAGAGIGAGVSSAIAGTGFGAGFIGSATAGTTTGFLAGAATSGSAGIISGFTIGAGNSWIQGNNFGTGLCDGIKAGLIGGAMGVVTGGLMGGADALSRGRNFWTGSYKQYDLEPVLLASSKNVVTDTHILPDDATIANKDVYKVYYKPEDGVYGTKNYVPPGKAIDGPIDGVATSKYTDMVFKVPDGGRVMVLLGGDVKFMNGYGTYDALKIINRAGWQNAQYFIDRGAYYTNAAKRIYGWDELFRMALRIKW